MKKGKVIIILFVIVIVAGGVYAAREYLKSNPEEPQKPNTVIVERGDLRVTVSATGTIEPLVKVEVKSKASGRIEKMAVEAGSYVKVGDLIAELDKTTTQNDVEQARADLAVSEARLRQAERGWKRTQELFDKGFVPRQRVEDSEVDLQAARSQLIRAKTNLSTAEERLEDTTVRAPMSGTILQKFVEEGQIISSGISAVTGGTTLVTMADLSKVYVKADVDETDIGKVKVGQPVRVTIDAFPDRAFEGEVLDIAPQAKMVQNVTTFEVTTQLKNPGDIFRLGMNASVEIIVADREDVVLVPNSAIRDIRGRKVVFVLEDGKPSFRPVETGAVSWEMTEIVSGLEEGEEVVAELPAGRAGSLSQEDRERLRRRFRFMGGMGGARPRGR